MLFIANKYSKWYHNIIDRAKTRLRVADQYYERHHIIPKCLGGNNSKDNLVWVTNREHFICHWLLTKMVNGAEKYKLWNAFSCMLYRENPNQERYKVTSRIFENIKIAGSKIKSAKWSGKNNPMYGKRGKDHPAYGKKWTDTHRKNASESHKGVIRTEESRSKQGESTRGRTQTIEHIEKRKLFGEKNGMYGKKLSIETIAKRTASMQKNKLAKKLANGENCA
jgi:hypothetical protein